MKRFWQDGCVVLAALVGMQAASPVASGTITPDLSVLRTVEEIRAVDPGDSLAPQYLAREIAREEAYLSSGDCIALGIVTRLSPKPYGNPERPGIDTVVTLSVEECLKGSCGDSLRFMASGGRMGDYMVSASGSATYSLGERCLVVLFWRDSPHGRLLAGTLPTAKYHISDDGVVPRKGILVDQLLEEVREVVSGDSALACFAKATLVLVAEVMAARWEWNARDVPWNPDGLVPIPVAVLSPVQVLKGEVESAEITVVQRSPRGAPGRIPAEFCTGEKVLVMLAPRSEGVYDLVGGRSGKYRLGDPNTTAILETIEHGQE